MSFSTVIGYFLDEMRDISLKTAIETSPIYNINGCHARFSQACEYLLEQTHILKNISDDGGFGFTLFGNYQKTLDQIFLNIAKKKDQQPSLKKFTRIANIVLKTRNSIMTNFPNSSNKCILIAKFDDILENAIEKVKDFNLIKIDEIIDSTHSIKQLKYDKDNCKAHNKAVKELNENINSYASEIINIRSQLF